MRNQIFKDSRKTGVQQIDAVGGTPVQPASRPAEPSLTGAAAFGDWRADAPGVARRITPADLPQTFASPSSASTASVVTRPAAATPHVPPGFQAAIFATDLDQPRTLRTAPNGDIFVAESGAGRIRILRPGDGDARPGPAATFAADLDLPFGIAFWPPGPSPRFVYVGETRRVVRYPYRSGDLQARGPAQVVVPRLPEGGHWTRDIVFSPDGARMFVAVGSAGNIATDLTGPPPAGLAMGAAWGGNTDRADVLAFTPDGGDKQVYASGLRNCSAEAIQPAGGALWCVVNERDGLGDNLPPDYATQVRPGAFSGWPWYLHRCSPGTRA